jgi:hypothetical protein
MTEKTYLLNKATGIRQKQKQKRVPKAIKAFNRMWHDATMEILENHPECFIDDNSLLKHMKNKVS